MRSAASAEFFSLGVVSAQDANRAAIEAIKIALRFRTFKSVIMI
jgi:hypothetical protein